MSSVKTTPRVGARPSTRSSPKMPCSTSPGASTMAATRSIASQARSRLLTLTFDISQLPGPRNWAMAGGSNGYLAAPVRRQLTPGLISSLPGTAGLPPFISFSTSYGELDSAVRRLCLGLANGGRNISRSLKLLCLKRNIGNLSAIQEKSGYLLRQRGNERFVGNPEAIPKRGYEKSRSNWTLQPLLRSPISENGDLRRAFRAALPLRRYTQC